jgi:threonine dehydrogenase-like Zn-dependent dehydrogenase
MRACVKTDMKKVEVLDIPVPEPGPGEIVIKMSLSTICGTDMHFLDEFPSELLAGPYPNSAIPQGMLMGHEAIGIVHTVGEGVSRFKPGDRVIASCFTACGKCPECLRGEPAICTGEGTLLFGCQSEYYRVGNADLSAAKVPEGVSDEAAVLATDILSTGLGAVERADTAIGDSVAVFAQGPVGLCATAGARARGCGLLIAVDTIPERLEMSRRFGANVVINAAEKDPVAEIMALTEGQGVAVAIEAVGTQKTFESCTQVVRRGGTVSSVGVYGLTAELTMATLSPTFLHRNIVTTLAPSGTLRMGALLSGINHGSLDLSALFTHRVRLEEAPSAYDLFRSREGGVLKIAVTP